MTWIQWCKCGRRILTTEQSEKQLPCDWCQKEQHAEDFHKEFDLKKEE